MDFFSTLALTLKKVPTTEESSQFLHGAIRRRQHLQPSCLTHVISRRRHAVLSQGDQIAIDDAVCGLDHEAVVLRAIPAIELVERTFDEYRSDPR